MTTIYSLLTEMQTWCSVSKDVLKRAKESNITTKNNAEFKKLVNDWSNGRYDEDPYAVTNEIEYLLGYYTVS